MANFMEDFNNALTALVDTVKGEVSRLNTENEEKIVQIATIRADLDRNAKMQKRMSGAMYEVSEVFETLGEQLYEDSDKARVVVDVLNTLTEDNKDEDNEDEGFIGYCEACGEAIYEDDEYVDSVNGLFCCEECEDEYLADEEAPEEEIEE